MERNLLPENISEYFGMFASERQNVIKGCDLVRRSPLIGAKIPVHGLLLDIQTGKLERLVNGYESWATMGDKWNEVVRSAGETVDKLKSLSDFNIGEMKFPETKIGETVTKAHDWLSQKLDSLRTEPLESATPPPAPSTAANIASHIVELAEKHWPKHAEPQQRPPPPLPRKLPTPPRIVQRPGQHSRWKGK